VQRCLIERRPITADVLNEYPDLAMQADEDGLTRPPVDDDYRPVWMRTRDEFCVSHPISAGGVPIGKVDQAKERHHEIAVQDAIERGHPVPSRVREYYGIESKLEQLGTSPQSAWFPVVKTLRQYEQHARDPEAFQAHIKMWESKIRPVETGYEQGALGHNDPN